MCVCVSVCFFFLGFLPSLYGVLFVDMDGFGAGGDIQEAPITEDLKQLGGVSSGLASLSGIFLLVIEALAYLLLVFVCHSLFL